jgi:hypothetical protein
MVPGLIKKNIYLKINNMTLIDLRINYNKGANEKAPLNYDHCFTTEYIVWLEEQLLKHINLKKRLIPWESLDEDSKLIHK